MGASRSGCDMCRLFLQSKSMYHVLLAVLCREIEWCKGNCVVVIYENTARLSTLRQGGRVKRKYKGASLRTHGTSATRASQRHRSLQAVYRQRAYRVSESTQTDGIELHLSRSPLVSSSPKKSRGSVILSIPRPPQLAFYR